MIELGQLEKRYQEFEKRNIRVIAISDDDEETAQLTQADFPHLMIVSDSHQNMASAFQVIHPGAGAGGKDTNAPTTFLVDGAGKVAWYARPERFISRITPEELLSAIDESAHKMSPARP